MPSAPARFRPLRTSARATLWSAGAAAALAAGTALTLDGGLASLALLGIGIFVACALYAVLAMSRYAVAGVAAAGTALAIGAGLAFLRLIGLAWDQDPGTVTAVSSRDADPFFLGAVAAGTVTLAVLLGGAVWPEARPVRRQTGRVPAPRGQRRPGTAPRPAVRTASARTTARAASPRTAAGAAARRGGRAASGAVSPASSRAARRSA